MLGGFVLLFIWLNYPPCGLAYLISISKAFSLDYLLLIRRWVDFAWELVRTRSGSRGGLSCGDIGGSSNLAWGSGGCLSIPFLLCSAIITIILCRLQLGYDPSILNLNMSYQNCLHERSARPRSRVYNLILKWARSSKSAYYHLKKPKNADEDKNASNASMARSTRSLV